MLPVSLGCSGNHANVQPVCHHGVAFDPQRKDRDRVKGQNLASHERESEGLSQQDSAHMYSTRKLVFFSRPIMSVLLMYRADEKKKRWKKKRERHTPINEIAQLWGASDQ